MSENFARRYDPIALSAEGTVVAEHVPEPSDATGYQSEAELETQFIELLESQAYERLTITSEADLIANLRKQLEALNRVTFSDSEWERFFNERIAGKNDGIEVISAGAHLVFEVGEDERCFRDVADFVGAGGDVFEGFPACLEQGEGAFADCA